MKYVCLGYLDEGKWDAMSEGEREEAMRDCVAYQQTLRAGGNFVHAESLQSAGSATTLRWRKGAVYATDGPYAETKEQLGGIFVIEARDLNHAIQLMSAHPGMRLGGPFEIRPADEKTAAAGVNALASAGAKS
jgi:hypothetical protein